MCDCWYVYVCGWLSVREKWMFVIVFVVCKILSFKAKSSKVNLVNSCRFLLNCIHFFQQPSNCLPASPSSCNIPDRHIDMPQHTKTTEWTRDWVRKETPIYCMQKQLPTEDIMQLRICGRLCCIYCNVLCIYKNYG